MKKTLYVAFALAIALPLVAVEETKKVKTTTETKVPGRHMRHTKHKKTTKVKTSRNEI